MSFQNCYADDAYAAAYAKLEYPGTYYLAFRDLPALFARHVRGRRALDFGCGAGRSTRFLARQGFEAVGVDIAAEMIQRAKAIDPAGDYRVVGEGDLGALPAASFDLVFAAFPFDNIPTPQKRVILRDLKRLLAREGRIISIVSAPEIYWHEWASFSTRDFPQNRAAGCGDAVQIINTALEDRRPATDILFSLSAYRELYAETGLRLEELHAPLGRPDEPQTWVSETRVAPWNIHVLV